MAQNITPAQQRVLQKLERGGTPKQIARDLRISVNGVYSHMRKLREKGVIPENGSRPQAEVEEAPASVSPNGSSGNGASETLAGVREVVSVQIKTMQERMNDIDNRVESITDESNRLEQERADLESERTMLADASTKLAEVG